MAMMNCNENENDYYEMVSDDDGDGSFGGEDETENSCFKLEKKALIQSNDDGPPFDFEDLPFVPKFSSEIRNTVEAAKNSENDNLETPLVGDWGGSSSNASNSINFPTNLNCPYFPNQSIAPVPALVSDSDDKNKSENNNSLLKTTSEICAAQANPLLDSCQTSSIIANSNDKLNPESVDNDLPQPPFPENEESKNASSSWADENGDPIQGAFDNIKSCPASESGVNIVNNTKVEYVFHVKEKKSDSDVGSVNEDISKGSVLSSLANLVPNSIFTLDLENKTISGDIQDAAFSETADEHDQKKLYEASKNKQELCKVISEDENIASTSGSGSNISDVLSKKKTEHFIFKRNNFINQSKTEETFEDQVTEQEVAIGEGKPDEKALESQALNELLTEVKQGAERARNYGALGWQKQPVPVVNKRFLLNTLASTLREPYKPPGRRGRFHKGLNDDRNRDRDSSSSSGSRSSRSSRSSSSYSSSSSRSRSRSHDRKHRRRHGRDKGKHQQGPWQGGPGGPGGPPPNAFYDWAAMGQYGGYPWYDPEAVAMYYGMDRYPDMYYNDPEYWAAYRDFYGMGGGGGGGGFNPGFRGRGQPPPRGRGWRGGGRGRGRGGMGMEFEEKWIDHERYSDTHSLSRSKSRSPSWSRSKGSHVRGSSPGSGSKRSRSPNREQRYSSVSEDSGSRNRSRGDSGVRDEKNRSKRDDSKSKKKKSSSMRSSSQVSEKGSAIQEEKDKKKKKKRKHKKSKKEEGGGDGGEIDDPSKADDGGSAKKDDKISNGENETSHVRKVMKRKLAPKDDDGQEVKAVKKKKKKIVVKKSGVGDEKKGKKKKGGTGLKGKKVKTGKGVEGSQTDTGGGQNDKVTKCLSGAESNCGKIRLGSEGKCEAGTSGPNRNTGQTEFNDLEKGLWEHSAEKDKKLNESESKSGFEVERNKKGAEQTKEGNKEEMKDSKRSKGIERKRTKADGDQSDRVAVTKGDRLDRKKDGRIAARQEGEGTGGKKYGTDRADRKKDGGNARMGDELVGRKEDDRVGRKEDDRVARKEDERVARKEDDRVARKEDDRLGRKEDDRLARKEDDRLARKEDERLARKERNRSDEKERDRDDGSKRKRKKIGKVDERRNWEEREHVDNAGDKRLHDGKRNFLDDSRRETRDEQNYGQRMDREREGGIDKGKKTKKIEEIERRLQERKAKRKLEENVRKIRKDGEKSTDNFRYETNASTRR